MSLEHSLRAVNAIEAWVRPMMNVRVARGQKSFIIANYDPPKHFDLASAPLEWVTLVKP